VRRWLDPLWGDTAAQWAAWQPLAQREAVVAFDPEFLLVVPTSATPLVLGERWSRALRIPSATWLMDDWIQQDQVRWPSGDADTVARRLLAANRGWLMISEYLADEVRQWTGLTRPVCVVHNAVTLGAAPTWLSTARTGSFRLGYAGSIWPMHRDALAVLADAVRARRRAGEAVELVLYTDAHGWAQAQSFAGDGVVWGGLVPYEQLRDTLGGCDLLVVASSFDAAHERMTRSSVQTKITDYLAAGRAILNVGPAAGACARFLQDREIACFLDDPRPEAATAALGAALRDRGALVALAQRGWEVVTRDHEIGAVGDRVAAFFDQCAGRG
jgi:glycosyltransferase involved in cell wall biosynthesis